MQILRLTALRISPILFPVLHRLELANAAAHIPGLAHVVGLRVIGRAGNQPCASAALPSRFVYAALSPAQTSCNHRLSRVVILA